MINLRMTAIVAFLLFASFAYGELSCDLNQGSLNGLRIGGATNPAALASGVNEVPIILESFVPQAEFYKFSGGVEIVTKEGGLIYGRSGLFPPDQKVSKEILN